MRPASSWRCRAMLRSCSSARSRVSSSRRRWNSAQRASNCCCSLWRSCWRSASARSSAPWTSASCCANSPCSRRMATVILRSLWVRRLCMTTAAARICCRSSAWRSRQSRCSSSFLARASAQRCSAFATLASNMSSRSATMPAISACSCLFFRRRRRATSPSGSAPAAGSGAHSSTTRGRDASIASEGACQGEGPPRGRWRP
mmetsp:Transcript_12789/g.37251  ORF Transcript_12789/g.37251 Transcript_12789/m.37251 type:complete len:202 (+) Transcript_12789:418-1023(+)